MSAVAQLVALGRRRGRAVERCRLVVAQRGGPRRQPLDARKLAGTSIPDALTCSTKLLEVVRARQFHFGHYQRDL